jgi:prepilin-type N-terminal cleavage/methylation domain-containing protein
LNRSIIINGFTLIECLLALTLFSVLITSVYSVFRSGVRAERSSEAITGQMRRVRWVMDDLSREIRNMVTHPDDHFQGEENRITFLTVLPTYGDVSETVPKLFQVSYGIETDDISNMTTFIRTSLEVAEEKTDTVSVHGVIKDLVFSYRMDDDEGGSSWENTWEDAGGVPSVVKIEIVAGDNTGRGEDMKFTQIVPVLSDREIGSGGDSYGSVF